jgi:hypothetical protein
MCGHGENLLAYLMRRANAVSNVMRETKDAARTIHAAFLVSISTKTFAIAGRRSILKENKIHTRGL